MHWLLAAYAPVATFELRPSNTTKTGGKTLLVPTPYAIKMALLDRLCRYQGVDFARQQFDWVRDLQIAARPPQAQAINRTFQKILRPAKGNAWNETIAMREFCVQTGQLVLGFGMDWAADDPRWQVLSQTTATINYFGQRGSFYQLVDLTTSQQPQPGAAFVNLCQSADGPLLGFLQRMDDMLPQATFDDISVYNKRAKGGRQSYTIILPYQVTYHGPNHTVWELRI